MVDPVVIATVAEKYDMSIPGPPANRLNS